MSFVEYLELLDAVARRERIEQAGGVCDELPPLVRRLGVQPTDWERTVRWTTTA